MDEEAGKPKRNRKGGGRGRSAAGRDRTKRLVEGVACSKHPLFTTLRNISRGDNDFDEYVEPRWAGGLVVEVGNFIEDVLAEIGDRPTPNHDLKPIDVNLGYRPGNIQWVIRDPHPKTRKARYAVAKREHLHAACLCDEAMQLACRLGPDPCSWVLRTIWEEEM